MIAALAAPAVACGGVVDPGNDAGTDATPDGPPPGCNVEKVDGSTAGCGGFTEQLSGDVSKCNVGGGSIPSQTCSDLCGGTQWSYCTFDPSTNQLSCEGICVGRLPANLKDVTIDGGHVVGEYLARAAHLEDAAVSAFAILAAELRAHGAPKSLTRSCLVARADEVRHAREVGELARAFGVVPPRAEVGPSRVRPLLAIAIENARRRLRARDVRRARRRVARRARPRLPRPRDDEAPRARRSPPRRARLAHPRVGDDAARR